jgi:hypothetical protein
MSEIDILPSPEITWPTEPESKWEREYRVFQSLRPTLLATHRGKYVAVHAGQVVESGDDKVAVAQQAYARFGYQPIYVGLVSDGPQFVVRILSPRQYGRFSQR